MCDLFKFLSLISIKKKKKKKVKDEVISQVSNISAEVLDSNCLPVSIHTIFVILLKK